MTNSSSSSQNYTSFLFKFFIFLFIFFFFLFALWWGHMCIILSPQSNCRSCGGLLSGSRITKQIHPAASPLDIYYLFFFFLFGLLWKCVRIISSSVLSSPPCRELMHPSSNPETPITEPNHIIRHCRIFTVCFYAVFSLSN